MTRPDLSKPYCYYVNPTQDDTEDGFVPSIVVEGESGHWPMAGDPAKSQAPWRWGDYETACRCARQANEQIGVSEDRAAEIVASSMRTFPSD